MEQPELKPKILTKTKILKMSKVIIDAIKFASESQPKKGIAWTEIEEDWFDWLESELVENNEK